MTLKTRSPIPTSTIEEIARTLKATGIVSPLPSSHDLPDTRIGETGFMSMSVRATREDPALRDLPAFHGVTWIRDHGGQVGFVSEPLPAGLRRRLLSAHFRMMRWVFAPSLRTST